jgi:hypothetical protein
MHTTTTAVRLLSIHTTLQVLRDVFPSSMHLSAQEGLSYFNEGDFKEAHKVCC